ncbi:hypothetical protein V7R84_14955 [Arachnia propionica]|uniref:hypothetical protein n=1 Tax=Arachnia propionica TaxID=1750 RepID=UPI0030CABFEB
MSMDMQLEIGAQQQAAETVLDTCDELSGGVKGFASSVEEHLRNVTGSAAASVVDVTNHWAESFKVFHEDLQRYAYALLEVDKAAAENEESVQGAFQDVIGAISACPPAGGLEEPTQGALPDIMSAIRNRMES